MQHGTNTLYSADGVRPWKLLPKSINEPPHAKVASKHWKHCLTPVKGQSDLSKISDADVLAEMTKCVFRSGFVWKIIEAKWPGFEAAFGDFDVMHCAMLADEDLEVLQGNTDIVRHGKKIASVRANAQYILDVRADHGSFQNFLTEWPNDDFVGLWEHLKKTATGSADKPDATFCASLAMTPQFSVRMW